MSTGSRYCRMLLGVACAVLTLTARAANAGAAPYTVDTTSDASLTVCSGADNDCSLWGAITNANGGPIGETINFAAEFSSAVTGTITIASALPALTGGGDIIDGTGRVVIIDGTGDPSAFTCSL
jgi:hypothetical protein